MLTNECELNYDKCLHLIGGKVFPINLEYNELSEEYSLVESFEVEFDFIEKKI